MQKEKRESLALTRVLTDHEAAMQLTSPKGLMLHGEVGTGKSMLIDLFADCLPNKKKKRWHFNSFMLETFSKLEQLRQSRLDRRWFDSSDAAGDEYSLLWLARDLVKSSPILFLDEFQLPDRASSKIMSNLMTNFFQLGGVLIATSNRMPEELSKAAGMEFVRHTSRFESLGWTLGLRREHGHTTQMFAGHGEFAKFLDLLRARCDIWEMEGTKDYRRAETTAPVTAIEQCESSNERAAAITTMTTTENETDGQPESPMLYFIEPSVESDALAQSSVQQSLTLAELQAINSPIVDATSIPWQSSSVRVYGRDVQIPRSYNGATLFKFYEICGMTLGPADYISLASTFHTFIITDIPVLTTLLKNEARRFITLLDALYESRCKLVVTAAAGPDTLFFPDVLSASPTQPFASTTDTNAQRTPLSTPSPDAASAGLDPETFSALYQDLTAPFRPNTSAYAPPARILAPDALEDDPPARLQRAATRCQSDEEALARAERAAAPDFACGAAFVGEDERFACRRAASRLWEMCGARWWARRGDAWWRPVGREGRRWEGARVPAEGDASEGAAVTAPAVGEGVGEVRDVDRREGEVQHRYGTGPFRSASEPPPKFGFEHFWSTVKWGKKAGDWGRGVDAMMERKKVSSNDK